MGGVEVSIATYETIAKKAGLDEGTTKRFCRYMRDRWAEQESLYCQVGYAMEWTHRFKAGMEFEASDHIGQAILRSTNNREQR